MIKYLLAVCLFIAFITACTPRAEIDDALIQTYLKDHNRMDSAKKDDSGIYYVITKEGTGIHATASSSVTVNYKGMLLDGTEFDAGDNVTFALSSVIEGWKIGIPLFKEGSKGTLYIPSKLAYGKKKSGDIPKNSVLIFDIGLISVIN